MITTKYYLQALNAGKVSKGGLFFVVDKEKDYQLVYTEPGSGSKKMVQKH
ncbi:hypothetical protein ACEQPO_01480 [Bacillus sp. SL00103]